MPSLVIHSSVFSTSNSSQIYGNIIDKQGIFFCIFNTDLGLAANQCYMLLVYEKMQSYQKKEIML